MVSYLYSYSGVSNPKHAININSGRYIVADYGNNRVIELDSTLSTVLKTYSINYPVFVNYSEENETLLITSEGLNLIREVTWSDLDFGTLIWQSTCSLSSPQSATYRAGDNSSIIISDMGNNRVIGYGKNTGSYLVYDHYSLSANDTDTYHDFTSFYKPMRAYQLINGDICVVEKEGRPINWHTIESSSSSYIENWSSSSSSSSSSYSSESSYVCCTSPICTGDCFAFSSWAFSGTNTDNTDNCKLYPSVILSPGPLQEVYIYSDLARTICVAMGDRLLSAGTIVLNEQGGSGISGSVYWDGTGTTSSVIFLECPDSSSESSSSSDSSSSYSNSFSSESSSSSSSMSSSSSSSSSSAPCCTNYDYGEQNVNLTSWVLSGTNKDNTDNCVLYVDAYAGVGPGTCYVDLYMVNDYLTGFVAYGIKTGSGTINIIESNSSGISGTVTWNGTDTTDQFTISC